MLAPSSGDGSGTLAHVRDAGDEVRRRLGMPALGPALVGHDDDVVDPTRRRPVPAVRHVEDVAADDRRPGLAR
jgi:hypothetical protein